MTRQPAHSNDGCYTGLVLDDGFKKHDTGAGHPERPGRVDAIRDALAAADLTTRCRRLPVREATDEEILAIHDEAYLRRLKAQCAAGARFIDVADSAICPESYPLACRAAGSLLGAVDAVMRGDLKNVFCAVRPPGHHCERDRSMGFCLLSNVAIAAQYLRDRHGLDRVAILDWDVHHGNGTQHLFENSSSVLVINLHGHPAYVYPGTGFAEERGAGDGTGATLNIPMYPGAKDADYRRAFEEQVLPLLDDFQPKFLLVSAGFDAHRRDPLAPLELDTESFRWMTRAAWEVANRHANGRLVSALEGGYDLEALGESVVAHVDELHRATAETLPSRGQYE